MGPVRNDCRGCPRDLFVSQCGSICQCSGVHHDHHHAGGRLALVQDAFDNGIHRSLCRRPKHYWCHKFSSRTYSSRCHLYQLPLAFGIVSGCGIGLDAVCDASPNPAFGRVFRKAGEHHVHRDEFGYGDGVGPAGSCGMESLLLWIGGYRARCGRGLGSRLGKRLEVDGRGRTGHRIRLGGDLSGSPFGFHPNQAQPVYPRVAWRGRGNCTNSPQQRVDSGIV
mmetsp:Transcript_20756/g.51489  ORF Transcript_20756/g.51489 Transcript_20756/m.51489 type:complete len:223 (+) Transcript_20756:318-986(+)